MKEKLSSGVKNQEIILQVRFAGSKLGRKKENQEGFLISQRVQNESTFSAVP